MAQDFRKWKKMGRLLPNSGAVIGYETKTTTLSGRVHLSIFLICACRLTSGAYLRELRVESEKAGEHTF